MTTLTYERHKGHVYGYDVIEHGYNYRSDEIHSAIGLCQLKKIDQENSKRRLIYKWYCEALNNGNIIVPFKDRILEGAVCHIMPVIVKENAQRLREDLKNAGVQTSKHYDLIPSFKAFMDVKFKSKVEDIKNIITLPMYSGLTKEDVHYISDILNN
jgi:dTDP-4-amino-4,6-dideoxygalactose transaminase